MVEGEVAREYARVICDKCRGQGCEPNWATRCERCNGAGSMLVPVTKDEPVSKTA
jgi:DnaJ-class molecular chaperone